MLVSLHNPWQTIVKAVQESPELLWPPLYYQHSTLIIVRGLYENTTVT